MNAAGARTEGPGGGGAEDVDMEELQRLLHDPEVSGAFQFLQDGVGDEAAELMILIMNLVVDAGYGAVTMLRFAEDG